MNIKGQLFDFSRPKIMGILNITPDSFYKNSRVQTKTQLIKSAEQLVLSGADILDIGANSTRPNSTILSPAIELERLGESILALRKEFPTTLLSLDTYFGEVAQFGIDQGIDIINDISAGQFDPNLFKVLAKNKIPYILSYNRANEDNSTVFELNQKRIVSDAIAFLSRKKTALQELGCTDIIIDPGFGFGKSLNENHELLRNIEHLHILGAPIMLGISRKSMIQKVLNCNSSEALNGTTALHALALSKGVQIFRVHDCAQMKEVILLMDR